MPVTTHELAVRLATKAFELRMRVGKPLNTEIHLSLAELASLFEVVAETTVAVGATPMAVAEVTRRESSACPKEGFCVLQVGHTGRCYEVFTPLPGVK